MFFNADQTAGALSTVAPAKAPKAPSKPNSNLSPKQFPGQGGEAEAGAGAEAAGAGAAEAGGAAAAGGTASLAELAPLLLV